MSSIERFDSRGYIVTLNTIARSYPDTRDDVSNYCNKVTQTSKQPGSDNLFFQSHLLYGDFDRITFRNVDRFSRYFDLDKRSRVWLGKHQNIYLYQIEPANEARLYPYVDSKGESGQTGSSEIDFGFYIKEKEQRYKYSAIKENNIGSFPFFALTQIALSNEILSRIKNFSSFLKELRTQLIDVISGLSKQIEYRKIYFEIYGSLNTSEITVMWLAEQYIDILAMSDALKTVRFSVGNTEESLFFSVYSMIGRSKLNSAEERAHCIMKTVDTIKGTAELRMTVSSECNATQLMTELAKDLKIDLQKDVKVCPGEHDIIITVAAKDIYNAMIEYEVDGSSNGFLRSTNIRHYILGLKISLLGDFSCDVARVNPLKFKAGTLSESNINCKQFNDLCVELPLDVKEDNLTLDELKDENNKKILNCYYFIRKTLSTAFNSHTGAIDTLDTLFADYLSNIHESYNATWRHDYTYQFKSILLYLANLLNSAKDNKEKSEWWGEFSKTIENIRQQTLHFAQSSRMVLQIPSSHLRYTSSIDMVFHAYYGMIKAMLESVYSRQGSDQNQSELLPLITTNSTPQFSSNLSTVESEINGQRILQIDIPYPFLYDPVSGFPFLVHEMFHFVAPMDRQKRNELFGELIINQAFVFLFANQIVDVVRKYQWHQMKKKNMPFENHPQINIALIESYNDSDFKSAYADKMNEGLSGKLRRVLTKLLWKEQDSIRIRKGILEEISARCQNNPNDLKFTNMLKVIWMRLEHLTISEKENLANCILVSIKNYLKEINDCILLEAFEADFWNIAKEHWMEALNPHTLPVVAENGYVSFRVDDQFIKGLRESVPDVAMTKICDMTDIEYLVAVARHKHDNGVSVQANYNSIRVFTVLLWIDQIDHFDVDVEGEGTKHYWGPFRFEKNPKEFIKYFIAEYKMLGKSIKAGKDKEIHLIANGIRRFVSYCALAHSFRENYSEYFDTILNIYKCYEPYFESATTATDKRLKTLTDIVKERRKNKEETASFHPDNFWNKIEEYCSELCGTSSIKVPDEKDVKEKVEELLGEDSLQTNEKFKEISKEYDKFSFAKTLEFLHCCSDQITLKKLEKDRKERFMRDKENKLSQKEPPVSPVGIPKVEQCVATVWDISEFIQKHAEFRSTLLDNDNNPDGVWYIFCPKTPDALLPTALKIDGSSKHPFIYEKIFRDRSHYISANTDKLEGISAFETVAHMTVEDTKNKFCSNLVEWKGTLFSSIDEERLGEHLVENTEQDCCIYMFSPEKYVNARNKLLTYRSEHREDNVDNYFRELTLFLKNETPAPEYAIYLPMNDTSKQIKDKNDVILDEQKMDIVSLLPQSEKWKEYLPIPIVLLNLGANSRFLAYAFSVSNYLEPSSKEALTLSEIQEQFFECLRNQKEDPKENAFLFRMDMKKNVVKSLCELARGF